jgi:hypothetical protein
MGKSKNICRNIWRRKNKTLIFAAPFGREGGKRKSSLTY